MYIICVYIYSNIQNISMLHYFGLLWRQVAHQLAMRLLKKMQHPMAGRHVSSRVPVRLCLKQVLVTTGCQKCGLLWPDMLDAKMGINIKYHQMTKNHLPGSLSSPMPRPKSHGFAESNRAEQASVLGHRTDSSPAAGSPWPCLFLPVPPFQWSHGIPFQHLPSTNIQSQSLENNFVEACLEWFRCLTVASAHLDQSERRKRHTAGWRRWGHGGINFAWGHWHSPSLCLQSTTTWQGLRGLWCTKASVASSVTPWKQVQPPATPWLEPQGRWFYNFLYGSLCTPVISSLHIMGACDVGSFWVALDAGNIHIADTQLIKTPEAVRPGIKILQHFSLDSSISI